ncbi:MAG: hypothetical protein AAF934_12575, partial [Bacteroidota bacterium]
GNSGTEFLGYTWNKLNSEVFSYSENGSVLELDLKENAVWLNGQRGGMLHTLIDGDFDFMATVSATKKSDISSPPDANFSFGGLVVRDPNTSQENYVHLVTGRGDTSEDTPYGYEHKVTLNSVSDYDIVYDGSWEYDLRIVRSEDVFTLYERPAGSAADWNEVTKQPLELSSQVQVGFNIYTGSNPESVVDLKVTFSNIQLTKTE